MDDWHDQYEQAAQPWVDDVGVDQGPVHFILSPGTSEDSVASHTPDSRLARTGDIPW